MTLEEYSTEIMRLHRGRRRMTPMIAEVVAIISEDQTQALEVTDESDRDEWPVPDITLD